MDIDRTALNEAEQLLSREIFGNVSGFLRGSNKKGTGTLDWPVIVGLALHVGSQSPFC